MKVHHLDDNKPAPHSGGPSTKPAPPQPEYRTRPAEQFLRAGSGPRPPVPRSPGAAERFLSSKRRPFSGAGQRSSARVAGSFESLIRCAGWLPDSRSRSLDRSGLGRLDLTVRILPDNVEFKTNFVRALACPRCGKHRDRSILRAVDIE